jgi:hypothetical protein
MLTSALRCRALGALVVVTPVSTRAGAQLRTPYTESDLETFRFPGVCLRSASQNALHGNVVPWHPLG